MSPDLVPVSSVINALKLKTTRLGGPKSDGPLQGALVRAHEVLARQGAGATTPAMIAGKKKATR